MMRTMETKVIESRCNHEWLNDKGQFNVLACEEGKLGGKHFVLASILCWKCGKELELEGEI